MNTPKLPPLPDAGILDNEIRVWTTEQMQAYAIAAIEAQGVPDGWQLVPKEPTDEMQAHAMSYVYVKGFTRGTGPAAVYDAMLASAPPAPQAKPDRTGMTYYKNDGCKAPSADHPDCICWTPAPQSWPLPGWKVQHPIDPEVSAELERSDWTPEEALRWYAAGRHYDTVPNGDGTSSARILDTGAVASNALKSLSREYAESKGDVALLEQAAVVQQEPVMIYHGDCVLDCGEHGHHHVELLKMLPAGSRLYTHPAKQAKPQPLSDEQKQEIIEAHAGYGGDDFLSVISAVERHYGIKE